MAKNVNLHAGDWVEVRSKEEILRSLDKEGRLDGLPFMPEMFQFCGKRFKVFKRAHKTCDTATLSGGRRMERAVHLDAVRCDGAAHGGCQAGCLIFWKEEWLKPTNEANALRERLRGNPASGHESVKMAACTEEDVLNATHSKGEQDAGDSVYVCQATRLPAATSSLPWWKISQYAEDYLSGNADLATMLKGFIYIGYYRLIQAGTGVGPLLRWLYDQVQKARGGTPFPRRSGKIPAGNPTPGCSLNLQPGELVRVKPYNEILATLDTNNRNRGLLFDAEMVPYCGGTYRVLTRVNKILDERTGKLLQFKTASIVLEQVVCQSRYSDCKFCPLFCPRAIYSYWREAWLERVPENAPRVTDQETALASQQ